MAKRIYVKYNPYILETICKQQIYSARVDEDMLCY